MTNLLLILLICHVLGDYILQSNHLAMDKLNRYPSVCLHALIYSIPFILVMIYYITITTNLIDLGYPWMLLIIPVLHYIIDTLKYLITKYLYQNSIVLYFTDQVLHILTIVIMANILDFRELLPMLVLKNLTTNLSWVLVVLLLTKPANVTFRICTVNIKTNLDVKGIKEDEINTGAIIGSLERILMVILLALQQWATIGLIFTGKSITRYQKIRENETFADYFLIGSIYSVIAVIAVYYLFFGFPS